MSPPSQVRLRLVAVPLRTHHVAAHGTERLRRVVLVEWVPAQGPVGWGECSSLSEPGYVVETTDEAWVGLRDVLVPAAVAGRPVSEPRWPAAAAALADAELDARLRGEARSLRSQLGGTRSSVPWTAVIAAVGAAPEEVARRAVAAAAQGAATVKVKIRPGDDEAVLSAVRSAVGDLPVAADANGSYRSLRQLEPLDRLGLAYLEQPMSHELSWSALARVRAALRTPIALDESLSGLRDVRDAMAAGAVDVVSVKPARLGGVVAAAAAARAAAEQGLAVFVGGMLELGVGRAAALAVASLPECTLPTDVGPSARYVAQDLTDPVAPLPDGTLPVPDGDGVGVTPSPDRLSRWVVDEVAIG